MKVLVVAASIGGRSGWGRLASELLKALRTQGVVLSACTEDTDATLASVRLVPGTSLPVMLRNSLTVIRAARSADVIHALDGWPYGVYGWVASLVTRKPLFITGIGTYSVAPLYRTFNGWFLRRTYAHARAIMCISAYTGAQLIKAGVDANKIKVVHMGTTPLPPLSESDAARIADEYAFVGDDSPIILTVGEIKWRKGQLDTLRAVAHLRTDFPRARYVLIGRGEGSYIAQLKEEAARLGMANALTIIHGANDAVLEWWYQRCDIVALNSNTDHVNFHFEGFGLVITEGYQHGKPAIGSMDSGIEDAIQDGVTGYLVPQGDVQAIAGKMRAILSNYETFATAGRAFGTTFTWDAMAAEYRKLFETQA